jgi:hypothetical protein
MIAAFRIRARFCCAVALILALTIVVAARAPALAVPPSAAAFNSN